MNQEKIGKFIGRKRKEKNLTQKELAEKLGVTNKTVSRWENGHYLPDISLFNEICGILDIEVTELLNGEEREKIEKKDVTDTIDKILDISKKEIKQKNIFMAIVYSLILLFIIILSFFVSYIKSDKIEIQLTNWNTYDDDINNIKVNMDKITSNSKDFYWWELKDFDIEDKEYEDKLNSLVGDIRICYMEFTRDGENYKTSNPILDYRDKKYITKHELKKLRYDFKENSLCLTRFYRYNLILISNDENKSNIFLDKINNIIAIRESEFFMRENVSYDELLSKKMIEVDMISRLSDWLVEEYYNLKK